MMRIVLCFQRYIRSTNIKLEFDLCWCEIMLFLQRLLSDPKRLPVTVSQSKWHYPHSALYCTAFRCLKRYSKVSRGRNRHSPVTWNSLIAWAFPISGQNFSLLLTLHCTHGPFTLNLRTLLGVCLLSMYKVDWGIECSAFKGKGCSKIHEVIK